jgi:spermidine synthase
MKYMVECLDKGYFYFMENKKTIFETNSKYQKIEIFENETFGRYLRLDRGIQTCESDEYLYHEPLVHVPMIAHPNPKTVLIVGGGDGGVLKQVLKHNTIKKVDMVELDEEVVNVSKKYLKKIHENSFENKKANIIIDDGIEFMKKTKNKYDIIILDLTDPDTSIVTFLYTKKFYDLVKSKLNKDGIISIQTEVPYMVSDIHVRILKTLMKSFKIVRPYYNYIPTYGTIHGFASCSDKYDTKKLEKNEIDKRIKKRNLKKLKMFNGEVYEALHVVPKIVKIKLKDKKIKEITEKSKFNEYEKMNENSLKYEKILSNSS